MQFRYHTHLTADDVPLFAHCRHNTDEIDVYLDGMRTKVTDKPPATSSSTLLSEVPPTTTKMEEKEGTTDDEILTDDRQKIGRLRAKRGASGGRDRTTKNRRFGVPNF